jgi:hypothetical protein
MACGHDVMLDLPDELTAFLLEYAGQVDRIMPAMARSSKLLAPVARDKRYTPGP